MANTKILVTVSETSDAYNDYHYILVTSKGPYRTEDGCVVGATLLDLVETAKKYGLVSDNTNLTSPAMEIVYTRSELLAHYFFLKYCKENPSVFLTYSDYFEDICSLNPDVLLGEEEIIRFYLDSYLDPETDFTEGFWAVPEHREICLDGIRRELDAEETLSLLALYDSLNGKIDVSLFCQFMDTRNKILNLSREERSAVEFLIKLTLQVLRHTENPEEVMEKILDNMNCN